jgi:hypothetical protein
MNRREFSLAALTALATPTFSFAQNSYPVLKAEIYPCNLNRELIVDFDDKFLDTFASWKGKHLSANGVMNGERFKLSCTENRREIRVQLSNDFEFSMYEVPEYLKMDKSNRPAGFSLVLMGDFYQNTIYFQSAKDRQLIADLVRKTFTGKKLYTHGIAWRGEKTHLSLSDDNDRSFESMFSGVPVNEY